MRSERAACSSQHPIVVRVVLVGKDGVHGMVRDSGRALCLEEDEEEKAQYLVNEVQCGSASYFFDDCVPKSYFYFQYELVLCHCQH